MDVKMAAIERTNAKKNAKIQLIACKAQFHWIHTDSEKVKCEINFNTRTKWIAEINFE